MNKKDKLNRFLHQSMQLREDELPKSDEALRSMLRAKVKARQQNTFWPKRFMEKIWRLLNIEIRLYQAGISLAAVAILMVWVPAITPVQKSVDSVLLADSTRTIYSSSVKQNKFLIQNFAVKVN